MGNATDFEQSFDRVLPTEPTSQVRSTAAKLTAKGIVCARTNCRNYMQHAPGDARTTSTVHKLKYSLPEFFLKD